MYSVYHSNPLLFLRLFDFIPRTQLVALPRGRPSPGQLIITSNPFIFIIIMIVIIVVIMVIIITIRFIIT